MPIFRPSELHAFLREQGVQPKKRLSQHFLIDGNIVAATISLAGVAAGECVLEIGPGPGVLTEALLEKGCHVIAVELDSTFASSLSRFSHLPGRLQVVESDVCEVNAAALVSHPVPLVANIPYHVTTPIFEWLFVSVDSIASATLMVQEEVAERCLALPGMLSLLVEYYTRARYGFFVPPTCFFPRPHVGSAVLRFDMRRERALPAEDEKPFFDLVRTAFAARRKMVAVALKNAFPTPLLRSALCSAGVSPTARPDDLSLAEWCAFYSFCKRLTSESVSSISSI